MNGILLFALFIFILWLGSAIFIPLLIATFLWYLINATSTYYRKMFPEKSKLRHGATLYNFLSNIFALVTFAALIYFFATRIRPMFGELVLAIPGIQSGLNSLWVYVSDKFGLDISALSLPNITTIVSVVGSSVAHIAASMGMVVVYMIFMFVEQSTFHQKIERLFPNKSHGKKIKYILSSIDTNMKKYLFMKTLVSAVTGLVSYAWMYILGLQFAGVWAFAIFILSYIPTIGAIVGCAVPILFGAISGASLHEMILLAVGLIALQIVFGNIIEPKLTGKTLNLSTLAILINLVFWGLIWGVAGMFFSVPLLVATFIITAQFDSTRWIAILLSTDGKIPDKRED